MSKICGYTWICVSDTQKDKQIIPKSDSFYMLILNVFMWNFCTALQTKQVASKAIILVRCILPGSLRVFGPIILCRYATGTCPGERQEKTMQDHQTERIIIGFCGCCSFPCSSRCYVPVFLLIIVVVVVGVAVAIVVLVVEVYTTSAFPAWTIKSKYRSRLGP